MPVSSSVYVPAGRFLITADVSDDFQVIVFESLSIVTPSLAVTPLRSDSASAVSFNSAPATSLSPMMSYLPILMLDFVFSGAFGTAISKVPSAFAVTLITLLESPDSSPESPVETFEKPPAAICINDVDGLLRVIVYSLTGSMPSATTFCRSPSFQLSAITSK